MAGATWNRWLLGAASCVCTVIQPYTTLHFIQNHVGRVDVGGYVFSCILPPALLAEWPGSFTRYCGNTGVERKKLLEIIAGVSKKVDLGEENSPAAQARTRTRDLFDLKSGALTTEVYPLPICLV